MEYAAIAGPSHAPAGAPQPPAGAPRPRRARGPKPSPFQKEMVAEFLEAHPDLARGRLVGPDAARRAADLWRSAAERLNASGGCVKSWKEWRKYWTDKKTSLKGRAARRLQHAVGTGGGPPANFPPLEEMDERMLAIMGDGFGQPDAEVAVPLFPEMMAQQIVAVEVHPEEYEIIEAPPISPAEEPVVPEPPPDSPPPPPPLSPPPPMSPPAMSPPPRHIGRQRRGRPAAANRRSPLRHRAPIQDGYREVQQQIAELERARLVEAQQLRDVLRQQVRKTKRIGDLLERLLQERN